MSAMDAENQTEQEGKRELTDDHLDKLADGRRRFRGVDNYLRALEKQIERGDIMEPEEIEAEAARVEAELLETEGVDRLLLLQRREELQTMALESKQDSDFAVLEAKFIAVAAEYGEQKNISYSTWREFGVSKPVLEAAGVKRTRRPNKPKE